MSASEGLHEAHRKTKIVGEEVERASDHAAVIGTVLAKELPDELQVGDVKQAIEHTEELEERLAESADTLAEVTAELEREIKRRKAVTEELKESRAEAADLADELDTVRKAQE